MNGLREFGGTGAAVLAAAGLSGFELELLAAIEGAVHKAAPAAVPAGEET
jgi:hypothetical protein